MEITLTYNFDGINYDYDEKITWEVLYDYFEYWNGALPKELLHLIDFDTLEDDDTFLEWLQTYCEEKAKDHFDEEYEERLYDCVDELIYELEDDSSISPDKLMEYCVSAATEASVKASDLYERLAAQFNLN